MPRQIQPRSPARAPSRPRPVLAAAWLLSLAGLSGIAGLAAPPGASRQLAAGSVQSAAGGRAHGPGAGDLRKRRTSRSRNAARQSATPQPPNTSTPGLRPRVSFNRDIRPILSDNCFACHGPDAKKRMAGLRLDLREEAVARGALVPGKPERSTVVARVFAADEARLMPPVSSHKSLTPEQKALLRQWVAAGAPYEAHWAYIPPQRPAVPKLSDPRYAARNPIDAFIREKLAAKGLLPSPEADPRTLLRRLYLDLTGIPPTPQELEAFVADRSPDAYERVVDRLLASPHYGERMAVPWLDVVRYADTVGFHGDQNQNAWAYRDYVIDSFNRNKPFDQFTVEQLAGDLLPNPTPEQRAATAFNRLTMMTREGGAQPKEYLAKYAADRVRTVGMAWLGSTLACCECHDHKYDPFSQKDFYSLAAFFADVKQWGVYADYGYTPNPDLKGYNNDYPFPPEIKVESRYLKEQIARQRSRIREIALGTDASLQKDSAAREAYGGWRAGVLAFLKNHPDGWETPEPEAEVAPPSAAPAGKAAPKAKARPAAAAGKDGTPAGFRVQEDGSVLLLDRAPADLEVTLQPRGPWLAALRVEALPSEENGNSVFRQGMDAATVTLAASVHRAGGKAEPVSFRYAGANLAEPRYRNGSEIVGVQGGWKLSAARRSEPHVSVWLPAAPLRLAAGDTVTLKFPNVQAGRLRVSLSPLVPQSPDAPEMTPGLAAALEKPESPDARPVALQAYLMGTGWNGDAFARVKACEAELVACRGGITPVLTTEAVQPAVVRVLPRGNWQDESGPVMEPHVPHFLPGYQESPGRRLTRLDLARWLVSPQNPLTARVFVNRVWRQFFGSGLSAQVEDLGAQGEWPTHPELLDYLASRFAAGDGGRETGDGQPDSGPGSSVSGPWDVKALVRLIVTSATYRQSSDWGMRIADCGLTGPRARRSDGIPGKRQGDSPNPQSAIRDPQLIDPNNRLLARQNPRRLEAEFVRDNALAVAGLLNRDLGGPPCKPYQPVGYYANIQFPDRDYVPEPDERQWRRGVYTHWQRTFLHPMLVNFDAPSREDCIAARIAANTPQQALTLLNDPEFVEAARVFAASLLGASAAGDAERIELAYERALARPAKAKEKQSLLAFLEKARAAYRERPEDAKKLLAIGIAPVPAGSDPVELAAWTSACRVILNLQETITRY